MALAAAIGWLPDTTEVLQIMKRRPTVFVLTILLMAVSAQAQSTPPQETPTQTRPRMVTVAPSPAADAPPASVLPKPAPAPVGPAVGNNAAQTAPIRGLGIEKIRARITEAERLFKTRPVLTALTLPVPTAAAGGATAVKTSVPSIDFVTVAALDTATSKIHFLTLPKTLFLQKSAEANVSSEGNTYKLRVLRANGVNTAVTVFDSAGRSLAPLVVQYPIERGGKFLEMAYYTSAHPALISPDVIRDGQSYVRTMIDLAAKRLLLKGIKISPEIMNVAERLCVVEHTDHDRFRRENRLALFEEIFALFALNELDTYRYAVSWAGAGGMVQMIPATYRMVRNAHPGVGLNPDFVVGMRNHGNALEAMLLYMQDTWNDLAANEEVIYALSAKLATQQELLSAGYNSNPARLPGYLKRGGAAWRTLIPRETQLYLQIYRSFESLIPMKARS
ncbi:MAG: hypothetical protein H7Y30_11540 [Pyrinomonadaceae bacterium]|nr:hypothetical protein [Pyrinomonadaceae bacterium]